MKAKDEEEGSGGSMS